MKIGYCTNKLGVDLQNQIEMVEHARNNLLAKVLNPKIYIFPDFEFLRQYDSIDGIQ